MSREADSKHTLPIFRWSETSAEVMDPNAVEPLGGTKDIGIRPGVDGAIAEYANWLWWAGAVHARYLDRTLGYMLPLSSVVPGAGAGAGVVTAGVGMTVDVTQCRVWLNGGLYVAQAASALALAAADPTNPRIDRVVARVVLGVPQFVIIGGTAAASPTAPAITDGDALIAQVRVNAAAVTPSLITDEREFGALQADRIVSSGTLRVEAPDAVIIDDATSVAIRPASLLLLDAPAVDVNATAVGIDATTSVGIDAPTVDIDATTFNVDATNVNLTGAIDLNGAVTVDPETFQLSSPITRKCDLPGIAFQQIDGTGVFRFGGDAASWQVDTATEVATLIAPVRIPNGAVIVAVRVRGNKANADDQVSFRFLATAKATNTNVSIDADSDTGSTGAYVLAATGLSRAVDQDDYYMLEVSLVCGTDGVVELWSAEVEYTETRPFNGL